MSMIPYDPAITRALKWMQNKAPRITSIIDQKQFWYDRYNTQFWQNWESTVFDLQTANPFGLVVWCIILGLPLDLFDFVPITNAFAYGRERGNYIDSGGNVPPMVFTSGPEIYADGVLVDAGDYSLNLPGGDITFVTAPALDTLLEWSGTVENEQGTELTVVPGRVFGVGDGTERTFLMTAPNPDDYNQVGYNFQGGGKENVNILSEVRYACQLRYASLVSNGRQEWINFMLNYIFNRGEPWDMTTKRYFYLTDNTENTTALVDAPVPRADTTIHGTVSEFQIGGQGNFYCIFTPTDQLNLVTFDNGSTVVFQVAGGDATALAYFNGGSFPLRAPLGDLRLNVVGDVPQVSMAGIAGTATITVPGPAEPPVPPGPTLTGNVSAFSRVDGGTVFVFHYEPIEDLARFTLGDEITFNLTTGDPDAIAQIEAGPNLIYAMFPVAGNIQVARSTSGSYDYSGITGTATIPATPAPPGPNKMTMEYHVGKDLPLSAQFINILNNAEYGIIPQLSGVSYTVIQDT